MRGEGAVGKYSLFIPHSDDSWSGLILSFLSVLKQKANAGRSRGEGRRGKRRAAAVVSLLSETEARAESPGKRSNAGRMGYHHHHCTTAPSLSDPHCCCSWHEAAFSRATRTDNVSASYSRIWTSTWSSLLVPPDVSSRRGRMRGARISLPESQAMSRKRGTRRRKMRPLSGGITSATDQRL